MLASLRRAGSIDTNVPCDMLGVSREEPREEGVLTPMALSRPMLLNHSDEFPLKSPTEKECWSGNGDDPASDGTWL